MLRQKAMGTSAETLEDFYNKVLDGVPEGFSPDKAHVNIISVGKEESKGKNKKTLAKYTRKNFYKVGLIRGESLFHYADKTIKTSGCTLMFFSSMVPYTWEPLNSDCTGIACIFNEQFFTGGFHTTLRDMPMYVPGNKATYELQDAQSAEIDSIFEKMQSCLSSGYRLKYDLIRNYIIELLHFALQMQPSESVYRHSNANARITSVFNELLERQFPIEAPREQISLRSPGDFADKLSVHVNHLNHAIRETTGKTTSNLIAERVVTEAKTLLKHTNWNISEISYSLGFEDMAHFGNFFKKQTSTTPSAYRIVQ